jgi:hypothetical protein
MAAPAPAPTNTRISARRNPACLAATDIKPAPDLAERRLQPERGANAVGQDGRHRHPSRIDQRHATAIERVGLDRIDHLVGTEPAQQDSDHAEQQPARRWHEGDPQRVDGDGGAQRLRHRDAEGQPVQQRDCLVHQDHQQSDQRAERRAHQDQQRLTIAQLSAHRLAEPTPDPPALSAVFRLGNLGKTVHAA